MYKRQVLIYIDRKNRIYNTPLELNVQHNGTQNEPVFICWGSENSHYHYIINVQAFCSTADNNGDKWCVACQEMVKHENFKEALLRKGALWSRKTLLSEFVTVQRGKEQQKNGGDMHRGKEDIDTENAHTMVVVRILSLVCLHRPVLPSAQALLLSVCLIAARLTPLCCIASTSTTVLFLF